MRTSPPKPSQIDQTHYETQNLYEASFLLSRGVRLVGKEKVGNKTVVIFEGKDVQSEAMKFYNGAEIGAKDYSDAYRCLKDYIFER